TRPWSGRRRSHCAPTASSTSDRSGGYSFEYHLPVGSTSRGQTADGGGAAQVADTFRLEYGRVVASVLRIVRDIGAAEEIVQEAFARALDHWPAAGGAPERPGAWL